MKRGLLSLFSALLLILGVGLLWLTNAGILSFSKPYMVRLSAKLLSAPNTSASNIVVFDDVNVLPMDGEHILSGQRVVVQQGRVAQIGPQSEIAIPDNALIVPGRGRYLMPGLTDAHVHIKHEDELLLFLAHGVTTVRDMWGTSGWQLALGFPDQLQMRRQIAEGSLLGPTIYTAGPIMEGAPPTSPLMPVIGTAEEARQSVSWQAAQGYDYIKVYDHLDTAVYRTILEVAQIHNLPVVGHAPAAVDVDELLSGGQRTIEHLTAYIDPDAANFRIPEAELGEYGAYRREAGVWNCPTLGVYTKVVSNAEMAQLEVMDGIDLVPPLIRLVWPLFVRQLRNGLRYQGDDYPQRIAGLNRRMIQALHEADAGIILGTDTDNAYLIPGLSALDELDALVAVGLTPYEALVAGTVHAAAALGHPDEFGTIAVGSRADLLLLEENPLEDVSHVRQRVGVMAQGRWYTETELRRMLAEMVTSFRPQWSDRLWPIGLMGIAVGLMVWNLRRRKKGAGAGEESENPI